MSLYCCFKQVWKFVAECDRNQTSDGALSVNVARLRHDMALCQSKFAIVAPDYRLEF